MSDLILGMTEAKAHAEEVLRGVAIGNMPVSCKMVIEMVDTIRSLESQLKALKGERDELEKHNEDIRLFVGMLMGSIRAAREATNTCEDYNETYKDLIIRPMLESPPQVKGEEL